MWLRLRQVMLGLLAAACLPTLNAAPHITRTEAVPVREADAVCGSCHRQIFEKYLKTPMANASGLAAERLWAGAYRDPGSGVRYTVSKDADGARLSFTSNGAPSVQGAERLRYFLGSGHIGLTYLYEKNGYWLESPVAFYRQLQGYTMAPGVEGLHGMPPALRLNPSCLRCHMSGTEKQVEGTDNLYRSLPFQQTGITCESCHGDTRQHVATQGRVPLLKLMALSPERRDSVCIVCHLEGDTSVERPGHAVLDYKPGEDIRESITYFVEASADPLKRAVSEIEQFNTSRCKRTTGAAMSCMSCHDPHGSPTAEERIGYYREKCLTCHSDASFVVRHFPATPDCTSCHMPKTGSENIAHVAWTDHRIRKRPDTPAPPMPAVRKADDPVELVSVLPGTVSGRDLGLAYYNLAVDGVRSARQRAADLLRAAARVDAKDVPVLRSLGILAELSGDRVDAASYYRKALQIEPSNYVSQTNLGTLLAASGDLEAAAALWKEAFQHNQDVPELGQNLASVECRLGDKEQARSVLTAVLTYSPGLLRSRKMLAELESGELSCPADATPKLTLKPLQ